MTGRVNFKNGILKVKITGKLNRNTTDVFININYYTVLIACLYTYPSIYPFPYIYTYIHIHIHIPTYTYRLQSHLKKGKLLGRQRLELVLDQDSPFLELSPLAGQDTKGAAKGNPLIGKD